MWNITCHQVSQVHVNYMFHHQFHQTRYCFQNHRKKRIYFKMWTSKLKLHTQLDEQQGISWKMDYIQLTMPFCFSFSISFFSYPKISGIVHMNTHIACIDSFYTVNCDVFSFVFIFISWLPECFCRSIC